jgi:hypothetical protein
MELGGVNLRCRVSTEGVSNMVQQTPAPDQLHVSAGVQWDSAPLVHP